MWELMYYIKEYIARQCNINALFFNLAYIYVYIFKLISRKELRYIYRHETKTWYSYRNI